MARVSLGPRNVELEIPKTAICWALACQLHIPNNFTSGQECGAPHSYPRGPRVGCETWCPKHAGPNLSAETRSRTRVSREPDSHRQREYPEMERTRSETLKLFVISDIWRRSSLLSSIRSIRSWQSSSLRSGGPSRVACPGLPRRRKIPGTDPV